MPQTLSQSPVLNRRPPVLLELRRSVACLQCINGELCYDFTTMEQYLNKPETLKAFGIPPGRG